MTLSRKIIFGLCFISLATVCFLPKAHAEKIPSNGKYVQYFPSSKQVWKITWRKDDRVLRRKTFYRSGKLYKDIIYRDGLPIVRRQYHTNGKRESFWVFKTQEMKIYDKQGRYKKTIFVGSKRFQ